MHFMESPRTSMWLLCGYCVATVWLLCGDCVATMWLHVVLRVFFALQIIMLICTAGAFNIMVAIYIS